MLILDTNILSEMMRPEPDSKVANWIVRQPSAELFTAAICQAEILAGLAIMPNGRRRTALAAAAHAMFTEDFDSRILPFDTGAAATYAEFYAARRKAALPGSTIDLMLAAIAHTSGATIVTRNVSDFQGTGLTLINPWQA